MPTPPVDISTLSYRKKSNAIIFNSDDYILLVQPVSYRDNEWNLPGGGIEEGETPVETILRELREELGTNAFEILEQSSIENFYDFPEDVLVRAFAQGRPFRGQHQTQFIIRFVGEASELVLQDVELRNHVWVPVHELHKHLIFPDQLQNVLKVIKASEALKHLTTNL